METKLNEHKGSTYNHLTVDYFVDNYYLITKTCRGTDKTKRFYTQLQKTGYCILR